MVEFRSDMTVDLVRSMASDEFVTQAARVSTQGAGAVGQEESAGLINFLVRDRHGSPFEHTAFTWYVEAPVFVMREMMRHRISSFNEESGRYRQLAAVFYVPAKERLLVQQGKPGAYTFVAGSRAQQVGVEAVMTVRSSAAYGEYQAMLDAGVAREVARMVLPVNIYSSAFVTMNARALTNFLSLRTKDDAATFPSFPMEEISMVADMMEADFASAMPLTYAAWVRHGRVPV